MTPSVIFSLCSKIFRQPILKLLNFPNFWLRIFFVLQKFTSLFGHPVQNIYKIANAREGQVHKYQICSEIEQILNTAV